MNSNSDFCGKQSCNDDVRITWSFRLEFGWFQALPISKVRFSDRQRSKRGPKHPDEEHGHAVFALIEDPLGSTLVDLLTFNRKIRTFRVDPNLPLFNHSSRVFVPKRNSYNRVILYINRKLT